MSLTPEMTQHFKRYIADLERTASLAAQVVGLHDRGLGRSPLMRTTIAELRPLLKAVIAPSPEHARSNVLALGRAQASMPAGIAAGADAGLPPEGA